MNLAASRQRFHAFLLRSYPNIYDATKLLTTRYSEVIQQPLKGNLEIEAIIGKRSATGSFSNAVPHETVSMLINLLDSFDGWIENTKEWSLSYDYYISKLERVRVTHHKDQRTHDHIVKKPLASDDFVYKAHGPLGGFCVRVNMKLEQEVRDTGKVAHEFQSVKISMRRAFVINSVSLPKIKFRIELGESWFGATVADAEQSRSANEGVGTVECEIIDTPLIDILADQDKYLLFTSLMLKVQDLFDFTSEPELCKFLHML
jgi:hypothetical protein